MGWLTIVAAAMAMLIQIRLEGPRWQMYGVFLLVALAAVATAWEILAPVEDESAQTGRRFGYGLGGLIVLAVVAAPAVILPVIELEHPPQAVGTTVFFVTDEGRPERYGPEPGTDRQIAIQIWYPAAAPSDRRANLVDDLSQFGPAASSYLGFPSFFLNHLEYSATGSTVEAPILTGDGILPVVVYSHGWGGFRNVAFTQAEELAANGFVVVGVDHTYGSLGTMIDGGSRFVPLDPDALPELDDIGEEAYAAASMALVDTFREDIHYAVDLVEQLAAGNAPSRVGFAGVIDASRLGVFGHSTGGGAAIEFCATDDRCDAVFGLDPWVEPVDDEVIASGVTIPMAAIRSEEWLDRPNEEPLELLWNNSGLAEPLTCIAGTVHRDFTLLGQLSPISSVIGFSGSLAPQRSAELTEERLVAFFSRYVAGTGDGSAGLDADEITSCG